MRVMGSWCGVDYLEREFAGINGWSLWICASAYEFLETAERRRGWMKYFFGRRVLQEDMDVLYGLLVRRCG